MLKLSGLSCERNNNMLFSNLTLDIYPGAFVNVIGQNGAGKTSLLKVLAGLWQPTTGYLSWCGQLLPRAAPFFWAALLYIGHESQLQPPLTPLQNLKGWISLSGITTATIVDIEKALVEVGLGSLMHVPCEVLSRGQRQRVLLARLWIHPPKCWILDEPFTALDTEGVLLLHKRFETHLAQGGIIIAATHQILTLYTKTFLKISLC